MRTWRRPRSGRRSTRATSSRSTPSSTTRSARSATPCASSCATGSCPDIGEWFEQAILPRELAQEFGRLGLFGMHLDGYGLPGASSVAYGLDVHRARGRRLRRPQLRLGAGLARDVRDLAVGLGGAEAALAAADARGRGDRLLRPDRAGRRLRPRLDAHDGAARRLRLDPQRHEDVDHERHDRRRRGRLGPHRGRRDQRLPRRARHARLRGAGDAARRCRCARLSRRSSSSRTCAYPRRTASRRSRRCAARSRA